MELEYLWEKFPDNAIFRNKSNLKWFGLILTTTKDKLGISSNEKVELLILKTNPKFIETIVDNKRIFYGYLMNKKNWISIILDETLNDTEIYNYIKESSLITHKKR